MKNASPEEQLVLAEEIWQLSQGAYEYGAPWTVAQFFADINNQASQYFFAKDGDNIIGYVVFHQVLDEAEIINIAVSPNYQGQKIGETLLDDSLKKMIAQGISVFFLEAREKNQPAISLYKKVGFKEIGKRKNYYHNPQEDGLMMQKLVNQA